MALNIGAALFPKVKRKLLTHFFLNQSSRYYLREITRIVNSSPGAVQRELKTLVGAGILSTEKVGAHRYYWVDPECMIHSELKAIVVKTFGVVDTLTTALSEISKEISIAFVYGSIARAEDTGKSDIDLLIIGDVKFRSLTMVLSEAEEILTRSINPTLYSSKEFIKKVIDHNSFITNIVQSEKLFVIGSENELTRMVE